MLTVIVVKIFSSNVSVFAAGFGWYLKKVVVMDSMDSLDKLVFPCNQ